MLKEGVFCNNGINRSRHGYLYSQRKRTRVLTQPPRLRQSANLYTLPSWYLRQSPEVRPVSFGLGHNRTHHLFRQSVTLSLSLSLLLSLSLSLSLSLTPQLVRLSISSGIVIGEGKWTPTETVVVFSTGCFSDCYVSVVSRRRVLGQTV